MKLEREREEDMKIEIIPRRFKMFCISLLNIS